MYRGFNLNVDEEGAFKSYHKYGLPNHEENGERLRAAIAELTDDYGRLIASKITENWFPPIDADVFICHAHADNRLAVRFVGFLKYHFDLTCFIDSNVWGCADELLRMIDDEYCYQPKYGTYNYRKRNRSTSHVHMMLSVALTKMINDCECIVFLNTPSSISSESYIAGQTTESPWIFAELAMTRLIGQRSPDEHRRRFAKAMDEALRVRYGADVEHLYDLNMSHLWQIVLKDITGRAALKMLYRITER